MPRLRLGVALLVPPPVACEVDGLRRACGDGSLGRVAPHLTLVPPVNVNQSDLSAGLARIRAAAASVAGPIVVDLGPVATFHPDTPVIYLEAAGSEEVHRLRDAVFHPPLARQLTWPFVPHVTLADEVDPDRIPPALVALADYRAVVTFDHLTLLQERQPGRVWAAVADARLGPPVVVARGGLPVELWWSSIADPEVAPRFETMPVTPDGARPFVVTARRDDTILGAARGWVRDGTVEATDTVVTDAAGLEDIERHLLAAVDAAAADAASAAAADPP